MTPKKKEPEILGRAMLVNVCVGLWNARKHDHKVTDRVNEQYARNPRAGRYHKRLFGGEVSSHSKLITAATQARRTHYSHTLPWEDSGWRLLPTENYYEYTEALRKFKERFEQALEDFILEYPELVKKAEKKLGKMYKRADYPKISEIRRKFHFEIQFAPLPASGDFRLELPKEELANITNGIEDRVTQAVSDAMTEAWQRLGDVVSQLRPKLDDGKHLRETMIQRTTEVAGILQRLNITNDSKLDKTATRVIKELGTLDVETMREDDAARAAAAKKADKILESMKGVYTPTN